ncbi:beta-lactamase hydrolase domain-containing protein [Lysobacter panacisoli]|nr:sulfur transferase domain-containing protein [Lysobacter panacisoli]
MNRHAFLACTTVVALAFLPSFSTASPPTSSMPATTMHDAIPNLREPRANLLTGGQPDASAWQVLATQGVTTVINLRPDAELGGRDEAAEVAAAGMAYVSIPVAGAGEITPANARALSDAIAKASGRVLVHCASGNRVGALLALGAAQEGADAQAALEFGKDAGLTGAEPRVRELLGLPPAP